MKKHSEKVQHLLKIFQKTQTVNELEQKVLCEFKYTNKNVIKKTFVNI